MLDKTCRHRFHRAHLVAQPVHLLDQRRRPLRQPPPAFRRHHPPRRAQDELAAEILLHPLQMQAERRLRHPQRFRSTGDRAMLDDAQEIAKLPHVHPAEVPAVHIVTL